MNIEYIWDVHFQNEGVNSIWLTLCWEQLKSWTKYRRRERWINRKRERQEKLEESRPRIDYVCIFYCCSNKWLKVEWLKTTQIQCYNSGKESTFNAGDLALVPGLGRSPGEEKGYHSSILAWRIPWGHKEPDMTKRHSFHSCGGKKTRMSLRKFKSRCWQSWKVFT